MIKQIYHYRPQRSCEGYVFTPVCHSVHGGCAIPACIAGGIPACLAGGSAMGGHLLGGCAWPGGVYSRGVSGLGGVPGLGGLPCPGVSGLGGVPGLGGCLVQGGLLQGGLLGDPPLKQTATVADGMHPTGMHSCYLFISTLRTITHLQIQWN